MSEQENTYIPDEAYADPEDQTSYVPDQRVSLRSVTLKAIKGEPTEFFSRMPEGYSGQLVVNFADMDPYLFWQLQRTIKAGHQVNVSIWYTQGLLMPPAPEPGGEQLAMPEESDTPVVNYSVIDAGQGGEFQTLPQEDPTDIFYGRRNHSQGEAPAGEIGIGTPVKVLAGEGRMGRITAKEGNMWQVYQPGYGDLGLFAAELLHPVQWCETHEAAYDPAEADCTGCVNDDIEKAKVEATTQPDKFAHPQAVGGKRGRRNG